jgi:hypothetical protein
MSLHISNNIAETTCSNNNTSIQNDTKLIEQELHKKYIHNIRNLKPLNKEMINNIYNMCHEDKMEIIKSLNDVMMTFVNAYD